MLQIMRQKASKKSTLGSFEKAGYSDTFAIYLINDSWELTKGEPLS